MIKAIPKKKLDERLEDELSDLNIRCWEGARIIPQKVKEYSQRVAQLDYEDFDVYRHLHIINTYVMKLIRVVNL